VFQATRDMSIYGGDKDEKGEDKADKLFKDTASEGKKGDPLGFTEETEENPGTKAGKNLDIEL